MKEIRKFGIRDQIGYVCGDMAGSFVNVCAGNQGSMDGKYVPVCKAVGCI